MGRRIAGVGEQLDRATVERVLRRAQELSAGGEGLDEPGVVDEAVLLEAAAEVGIDPAAVRQSLALEKFSGPTDSTGVDRIIGPRIIVRSRVIDADSDEVLHRLNAWLSASGRLVAVRRTDGTMEWIPRTGVWAALSRLRRPPLAAAAEDADRLVADVDDTGDATTQGCEASAGESTPPSSVVRLTLDRTRDRTSVATRGAAVSGAGVVGSLAAVTVLVPGLLVVTVPAIGLGAWLARGGRRRAGTMGEGLDRLLDVVDAGDRPPTMTDKIRRRATPRSKGN